MSLHRFDPEIAAIVGTNAATIYENLCHWTAKNAANGRHDYDGQTWTYNSISAFSKLFPYLTPDQIRGALGKLLKADLIAKGNYNKAGYDRTLWYAVKSQMHLVKIPNGIGENPKPIPDNKPDNKPDIPPTSARTDLPSRVFEAWNEMAAKCDLAPVMIGLPPSTRDQNVLRRLGNVSGRAELIFKMIENVPLNPFWIGRGDKYFLSDFDWFFSREDNFKKALEYKPKPKAQHDRPNRNSTSPVSQIGERRRDRRGALLDRIEAASK